MLGLLKSDLAKEQNKSFVIEAAIDAATDSSVKDAILDNPETAVVGAEDDPEIAKLVSDLPEYDDEVSEKDLQQLEESYIPETILK